MNVRNLHENEIAVLESQGCFCADWTRIFVKDPFLPSFIRNVHFDGEVKIGAFQSSEEDGPQKVGLYDSEICDCSFSDHVLISNVRLLKSYDVGKNAVIRNVGSLSVEGASTFGNGTEINVVNEGGGRTIKIYDRLTSQIAYMLALYRHRPDLIKKLNDFIDDYVRTKHSTRGIIGDQAQIINCQSLKNIAVESFVHIEGVNLLENGTIAGDPEDPTFIGSGVYARNFIVQSGAVVDSSAVLTDVFVGQSVKIGRQFSAENCAFFANCEAFHGEACSILAGPYTVSHHKSTLLIAGLFSFYNAGSGTNQSNHMYKLGPNHQGILQRGSKTGSFSYLLWPCAIGPFSVVIGKHYANFDASDLPFSYINEENDRSVLTPAMNLLTVGTRRDSQKWPSRDRRKGSVKFDLIHFDLFNPFTIGKVVKAIEILNELYANASKENEYVSYKGIFIKRLLLKTCRKYYELAVKIFMGDCIASILNEANFEGGLELLSSRTQPASFEWIDLCGMFAPTSVIADLLSKIEKQDISTLDEITDCLHVIHHDYTEHKWEWCCQLIEKFYGEPVEQLSKEQLDRIMTDWKTNRIKLNNLIIQDASKEFDQNARIGYGLDDGAFAKDQDFEAVHGAVDTNQFIKNLRDEMHVIDRLCEKIQKWIDRVKG
ncbi:MAG: DUF4954 family protein [Candidatus Omnitrophica bacterium]|nr:DUF4954 family protein [Candidatus Omnitrophota bacterium]